MIHFDLKLFIFQQNHQGFKQKHLITR